MARGVADLVGLFKINVHLFTAEGPVAVRELVKLGAGLFLDLKFHDIPNTVAGAVAAAAGLPGVRLLDVHATGGLRMMRAGAEALAKVSSLTTGPKLLGVTILTSLDAASLKQVGIGGCRALGQRVSRASQSERGWTAWWSRLTRLGVSDGPAGVSSWLSYLVFDPSTRATRSARTIRRASPPQAKQFAPGRTTLLWVDQSPPHRIRAQQPKSSFGKSPARCTRFELLHAGRRPAPPGSTRSTLCYTVGSGVTGAEHFRSLAIKARKAGWLWESLARFTG